MGNSNGSGFMPGDKTDPARYAHDPNILKLKKEDFQVPLTEREILTLSQSWKTVRKHRVNTGVTMFLEMFKRSSEVKDMFEKFRTTDNLTELESSRVLEAHALLVVSTLDESFTNFDDQDYVIDNLLGTGLTHRRFEEINAPAFWAIEKPFLLAVRNTLGAKRYTTDLHHLYRKAIRFILAILIVGFTQAQNNGCQSVCSSSSVDTQVGRDKPSCEENDKQGSK